MSFTVNSANEAEIAQQTSSDDDDDCEIDTWIVNKTMGVNKKSEKKPEDLKKYSNDEQQKSHVFEKFKQLRERRQAMKDRAELLRAKNQARKAKKSAKRAIRDPAMKREVKKLPETLASDKSRPAHAVSNDVETEWNQVKKYMNVNKHLTGPVDHGWCGPKTELERKIDDAIDSGNIDKAEKLNDQLMSRNFGVKVDEAFKAKKYDEKRQIEKEEEKAKRQKTLNWGFEAKQRWEMKSNL